VPQRATETFRQESELGAWELVLARPQRHLRGIVEQYSGYTETGGAAGGVLRQEVPSTRVPLIVNFGAPWRLADDAGAAGERRDSFVAGLYESSTFVAAEGTTACVQVDFTPIGAHLFLGLPMHELANRVVDLEDLLGKDRDLAARLEAAATWDARFDLIEAAIGARVAEAPRPAPEIVWAWNEVEQTHGAIRVSALAEKLGRSRRHLTTRFREHVGLGPKTFARVVRFGRAVDVLRSGDAESFAEVAHECGYFDQAHLNRDFRQFAGTTPAELATRLLPGGGVSGA
jgi:AraC-like DNA-binding protein